MKSKTKLSERDQKTFENIQLSLSEGLDKVIEFGNKNLVEKTPELFNEALDMLLEQVLITIHKMDQFQLYLEDQCEEDAIG